MCIYIYLYIYIYVYDWFFLVGPLLRKIEKRCMNLVQEIKRQKSPYFRIMKKIGLYPTYFSCY